VEVRAGDRDGETLSKSDSDSCLLSLRSTILASRIPPRCEMQFKFLPLYCILVYMEQEKLPATCLLLGLGFGTVLALALLPQVFAEAAAAAIPALALPPVVFAEGAAATVLATVLPPIVFAEGAAAAVLALAL